jgi:hypothetical protein
MIFFGLPLVENVESLKLTSYTRSDILWISLWTTSFLKLRHVVRIYTCYTFFMDQEPSATDSAPKRIIKDIHYLLTPEEQA